MNIGEPRRAVGNRVQVRFEGRKGVQSAGVGRLHLFRFDLIGLQFERIEDGEATSTRRAKRPRNDEIGSYKDAKAGSASALSIVWIFFSSSFRIVRVAGRIQLLIGVELRHEGRDPLPPRGPIPGQIAKRIGPETARDFVFENALQARLVRRGIKSRSGGDGQTDNQGRGRHASKRDRPPRKPTPHKQTRSLCSN